MRGARVRARVPAPALGAVALTVTVLVVMVLVTGGTTGAAAGSSPDPQWPSRAGWGALCHDPAGPRGRSPVAWSGHRASSPTRRPSPTPGPGRGHPHHAFEGASPTIVVDYGKDVGGVPFFVVRSVSGTPVLRSIYSEGSSVPRAFGRPVAERQSGG